MSFLPFTSSISSSDNDDDDHDDDDDDDADDDNDKECVILCAKWLLSVTAHQVRAAKWQHTRILWDSHVQQLHHENLFERTYRMSYTAFMRLKLILGNQICFDVDKAPAVMPILPEIVIATGLK